MNIVDSSGWIEYFINGANAGLFEPLIGDLETLITPTICLYEVFKRVLSEFGEERALEVIGIMSVSQIADLDRQTAIEAARISKELKLAMADSIILATARSHGATLWTMDAHFQEFEGVRYIES